MPFSFKKFFGLSKKESPKKESPKKESAARNSVTSAAKEASKIRENLRATRRAEREAATATRKAARKAATNARQAARDEWKERVKEEIEPLIAEVVKHNAEIKLVEFIREYKVVHNKKPDVDTIKDRFIQLKKLEILNINDTVMIPSIMNRTPIEDMEMEIMNMKISEETNANLPRGKRN
jgi:hypothetical protein